MADVVKKSKFAEFSRDIAIFNRKMNNGFVFRASKCINTENFIKIKALSESLITQYPRFLHKI
jgi:hypothetical protein